MHRSAAFNAVLDVFSFNESEKGLSETFLDGRKAYMQAMWNGEIYQNYPQVDQPNYDPCYWADAQAGLYAVKVKYDPTHAFTFAQEVRPLMLAGVSVGPVSILPPWLQQAIAQPIVCD